MGYGELAGEKKELLFTKMKKITRNRVRVRVSIDKISSSVLDRLILGGHYTYEYSYRVGGGIYKYGVNGTLRYTFENDI